MRAFRIKSQSGRVITQRKHSSAQKYNQRKRSQSQFGKKRNFSAEYVQLSKKFNIKLISAKINHYDMNQPHQTNRKKAAVISPGFGVSQYNSSNGFNRKFLYIKKVKPHSKRGISQPFESSQIEESQENQKELQPRVNLTGYQSKMLPRIQQSQEYLLSNSNQHFNQNHNQKIMRRSIQLKFNWNQKYYALAVNHFRSLFQLKEAMQDQITQQQLIVLIKKAILQDKQVSHHHESLDGLLSIESHRKQMRRFLCLQRSILIGILDCIMRENYIKIVKQDSKRIIESIIGVYYYIFVSAVQNKRVETGRSFNNSTEKNLKQMQLYCQWLQNLGYHIKKDLASTNVFIQQKSSILFRKNSDLLSSIRRVLEQSAQVHLSYTYYDLMSSFALYLNFHQKMLDNYSNLLIQFATSPAPYLTSSSKKQYTLVIDLNTIVHTFLEKEMMKIKYRNHYESFLAILSQFCQIVLFTLHLPGEINSILRNLKQIDYCLYRAHATREKHFNRKLSQAKYFFLKDLSRIGRPMNRIIGIESQILNMKLQPQNCIEIGPCKRNSNDNDLKLLTDFIVQLVRSGTEDVRQKISMFNNISN